MHRILSDQQDDQHRYIWYEEHRKERLSEIHRGVQYLFYLPGDTGMYAYEISPGFERTDRLHPLLFVFLYCEEMMIWGL